MSQQEMIIMLILIGGIGFGLLSRASRILKKATNFLLFFRNLIQIPFSWIGKKFLTGFKNLFEKTAPTALKEFSETRLKPWGGFGTVVLFALVTITNIVVTVVSLCSPDISEKLSDFSDPFHSSYITFTSVP